MVCIDSSDHSKRALDWCIKEIYRKNDVLGLLHVHVVPSLSGFGGDIVVTDMYSDSLLLSIAASKGLMEKMKTFCEVRGVTPKIFLEAMNESVGNTICTFAKKHHASLIVCGQRGLGAFRRAIFGSVSDYVLRHSSVTVATVPPSLFPQKFN